MADSENLAAQRALAVSTFSRLKDLVRELEDNEKRASNDFGSAQVEFRMGADDVAWYVAYKTSAEAVRPGEINQQQRIR